MNISKLFSSHKTIPSTLSQAELTAKIRQIVDLEGENSGKPFVGSLSGGVFKINPRSWSNARNIPFYNTVKVRDGAVEFDPGLERFEFYGISMGAIGIMSAFYFDPDFLRTPGLFRASVYGWCLFVMLYSMIRRQSKFHLVKTVVESSAPFDAAASRQKMMRQLVLMVFVVSWGAALAVFLIAFYWPVLTGEI